MPPRSARPDVPEGNDRTFPRLQVEGRLLIAFADSHNPAWLINISAGGFAVQTVHLVEPGERRGFFLSKPDQERRLVSARAIHCAPSSASETGYISGWAIEHDQTSESVMNEAVRWLTGSTQIDI